MSKEVIILHEQLCGGVATFSLNLSNCLSKEGYSVIIVPTQQSKHIAPSSYISKLSESVTVYYLKDDSISYLDAVPKSIVFKSKVIIKLNRSLNNQLYKKAIVKKKYGESLYRKVKLLKRFFCNHPGSSVIALGNHSIWLVLLANMSRYNNKIILSERSDPNTESTGRTELAFIDTLYSKSDYMVFQTHDAMDWYSKRIQINGRVIFNPVNPKLPEPFIGTRKKAIVNYSEINPVKNHMLLIDAFEKVHEKHPDFYLQIFGDDAGYTPNYSKMLINRIEESKCSYAISVMPARNDIHEKVKDYYMFVSSSDHEGMSNSMLEALAIGLPTICTDCPIGGAREVIQDHVNGILTPVGDADALSRAMLELIENPELAEKLSQNGRKIREDLSVESITKQWIDIIES